MQNTLIISVSRDFWDGTWRSRHQVMSRLAVHNKVVFVCPPSPYNGILPRPTNGSALRKPGVHRVTENLYVYIPPAYLFRLHRCPWAERILENIRILYLKRFIRVWSSLPLVLYLWNPIFEGYIKHFRNSIVCYHIHDEFSAYNNRSREGIRKVQKYSDRVISRADLIFTVSETLYHRYKHEKTHFIPNGVDYESFQKMIGYKGQLPREFQYIPKPIIGYMGTLRAEIDLALLLELAHSRPAWSFVFVGGASRSISTTPPYQALAAQRNVHMLGPQPAELVPWYLRGFDVGLLCYLVDSAAHYCYPLKMHEYLAVGLPVVSSPIPAVTEFRSVIRIACSSAEWLQAIEQSLTITHPDEVATRKRVAAQNTWDQRVQRIAELIEEKITSRK